MLKISRGIILTILALTVQGLSDNLHSAETGWKNLDVEVSQVSVHNIRHSYTGRIPIRDIMSVNQPSDAKVNFKNQFGSRPVFTVTNKNANGQDITVIEFCVSTTVPANTTYLVQNTFNIETMHTGTGNAKWSMGELFCWQENRDTPAITSEVTLDDAGAESNGPDVVSGSRTIVRENGLKVNKSVTHTLKLNNTSDSARTMCTYYVFVSTCRGNGSFEHEAVCKLESSQYAESLVPQLEIIKTYTYHDNNNPYDENNIGNYPVSNLLNSSIWEVDVKNTDESGKYNAKLSTDNYTIDITRKGSDKMSNAAVVILDAKINVPAKSDMMACYDLTYFLGKTQLASRGNTIYGMEIFDLGENLENLFDISHFSFSNTDKLSDERYSIDRRQFNDAKQHILHNYKIFARYNNDTKSKTTKHHYLALFLFQRKVSSTGNPCNVVGGLQLHTYDIYPTMNVRDLNQGASARDLKGMQTNQSFGNLFGMKSNTMKKTSDPRTISITSKEMNDSAHIAYLSYSLSENVPADAAKLIKLYDYKVKLAKGSYSAGGGYQIAELFRLPYTGYAIDTLNFDGNRIPSNLFSQFRVVNSHPDREEVIETHRVPMIFEKTDMESTEKELALVTATPVARQQQPAMTLTMNEVNDVQLDQTIWLNAEQQPEPSSAYHYLSEDISTIQLKEKEASSECNSVFIPFTMNMAVSAGSSYYQMVTVDLSIKDSQIYLSDGYIELFQFGDKDLSGNILPNLNRGSDEKPSNDCSVRRIWHQSGFNETKRTMNILVHFKNKSSQDSIISQHFGLLLGTNCTSDLKHKYVGTVHIKSNCFFSLEKDICSSNAFLETWQDVFGYKSDNENEKYADLPFSVLKKNGVGLEPATYFSDPDFYLGSITVQENLYNNLNDAQFLQFTVAAMVPAHSIRSGYLNFYHGTLQNADSNPNFMTELFSFGTEDRSKELLLNVFGSDDLKGEGSMKYCPTDYGFSQSASYGSTAYMPIGQNCKVYVEFRNDSDKPKLVRHHMGYWNFCQYADRSAPWYEFFKSDVKVNHAITSQLFYNGSELELNRDTLYATRITNVKTSYSDDSSRKPVSSDSFIATQILLNNNSLYGRQVIDFTVQNRFHSESDTVNLSIKMLNLNRNIEHLPAVRFKSTFNLSMEKDGAYRNIGTVESDVLSESEDSRFDFKVPVRDCTVQNGIAKINLSMECTIKAEDNPKVLGLFRIDIDGSTVRSDGAFEYLLKNQSDGRPYAAIAKALKKSVTNDVLPSETVFDGVEYPVRIICTGALDGLENNRLVIPGSITEIQSGAFRNCSRLEEMIFAESESNEPCIVYATHSTQTVLQPTFNAKTAKAFNSGSVVAGCTNLHTVIFNREVAGGEPDGNFVQCSPFVKYTTSDISLKEISVSGSTMGGFISKVILGGTKIGTVPNYDYSSPVTTFRFTSKAKNIGAYICSQAKEAEIVIDGDAHFDVIGEYSFFGTGLKSFDFSQADKTRTYSFGGTPIKEITITPNVNSIGTMSIATDSLMKLTVLPSLTDLTAESGDRWANMGILPKDVNSLHVDPDTGEWKDGVVKFLTELDLNRNISSYTWNGSLGKGPFKSSLFERNLNYSQYRIGNQVKTILPSTFEANNFEYFDIGDGVQSIAEQGLGTKTLHSLKIGLGLSTLSSHAFMINETFVSQEFIDKMAADIELSVTSQTWWGSFIGQQRPNVDFGALINYIWSEWRDAPVIHDIFCTAIASRQATSPTTSIDIFADTVYQTCTLRYTSPGLTEHYPWNLFKNSRFVVDVNENQRMFAGCEDEDAERNHSHAYRDIEVSLERTIRSGWNTICLPFDCPVAALGDGLEIRRLTGVRYNSDGIDAGVFDLTFTAPEEQIIRANVPYIIHSNTDLDVSTVFSKADVYIDHDNDPSVTVYGNDGSSVTMIGVYGIMEVPEGGNYIISDNRFYEVDSAVRIKALRAYFHADDGVGNNAPQRLRFAMNGNERTGVIVSEAEDDASLTTGEFFYDINGRKVAEPVDNQRIYIRADGTKVLY